MIFCISFQFDRHTICTEKRSIENILSISENYLVVLNRAIRLGLNPVYVD